MQLKRITKEPNTPFRISVDRKEDGDADGGFLAGGSFLFFPAGQEGDTHQCSEYAARVIMGDPGLAEHFECQPPLTDLAPQKAAAAPAARRGRKPKQAPAADEAPVAPKDNGELHGED